MRVESNDGRRGSNLIPNEIQDAVLEEDDEDDFDEALDNMSFAMSGVMHEA